jgi:hypothetical protein
MPTRCQRLVRKFLTPKNDTRTEKHMTSTRFWQRPSLWVPFSNNQQYVLLVVATDNNKTVHSSIACNDAEIQEAWIDEKQRSHAMQPSSNANHGERRVSFYGRVRVIVPDCSDLTDEHRASLWYSHNELLGLRAARKSTIELMVAGIELPIDDCSDGLHTPDKNDLRKLYSVEAINEVLME